MSTADLLTKTVDAGILAEDGTEAVRLGEPFATHLESVRAETADLDEGALVDRLEPFAPGQEREALASVSRDAAAEYLAIAEFADDIGHEERLRLLTVLDQLRRGAPPDEGAPASFLPVHGDRLELLFRIYGAAIVYVWRHDCPPCDVVRGDLEELLPEKDPEIALLAVYGPDWSRLLQEEYDITGGPTTLFVENGSVDLRLYGAQYPDVLEREIDRLRKTE